MTLSAKELRIGNLVISDGQGSEVKSISYRGELIIQNGFGTIKTSVKNAEPIPLTEKHLIEFGFETDKICAWLPRLPRIQIGFYANGMYLNFEGRLETYFGKKIEYAHQLQNIFFDLGHELSIVSSSNTPDH